VKIISFEFDSKLPCDIQFARQCLERNNDPMKIFAFIGISDSGKTRLIRKLIEELKKREYTVSVIKHCAHGFDLETPGKDTDQFVEAGSDSVWMYASDGKAAMQTKKAGLDIRRICREHLKGSDYILIEGTPPDKSIHKIEVLRKGISEKKSSAPEERIALVSDIDTEKGVPVFHPDDIEKIADFLENFPPEKEPRLRLDIDDVTVPMNPFVQKIFANTLMGMISSLEGIPDVPENITVTLSREGKKDEKT
jgi:molybdopterin-guanine dinucleotide biosynthesis protein B